VFAPGVHLIAARATTTPSCHTGAVRIQLVQAAPSGDGQIEVVLQVTAEPRLLGFCEAGAVQVVKAVDDRGQSRSAVPPPPADYDEPLGKFGLNKFGGLIVAYGNVISATAFGGSPGTAAGPYQTTLRLLAGKDKSHKLTELTGKLVVQTAVEADPVLVVDNVLQAAGKI